MSNTSSIAWRLRRVLPTEVASSHEGLKTYLLCAPHLEGAGSANNALVVEVSGELLVAQKSNRCMVLMAKPFAGEHNWMKSHFRCYSQYRAILAPTAYSGSRRVRRRRP